MNWPKVGVFVLVAGLLLGSAATVLAQRPNEGTASPPSSGGSSGGGNTGGMGFGSAGGSSSGGGAATSGGGSGWSGGGGSSWGGGNSGGSPTWGGSTSTLRPRDGGPRDGGLRRPGTEDQAAGRGRDYSAGSNQVPWYSRPRGSDIPPTGTAISRTDWNAAHPPGSGGGGSDYPWWAGGYYPGWVGGPGWGYPGYYRYGYPDCGYGVFGPGYFFYNPYGWNYYGGCGYYGGGGYGTYGWYDTYSGFGVGTRGGYYLQPTGGIRFKVKPASARIFVDGYFAGKVDAFDGRFQRLAIERGKHTIEVTAEGYVSLTFEVNIRERETITWEGDLEKIK